MSGTAYPGAAWRNIRGAGTGERCSHACHERKRRERSAGAGCKHVRRGKRHLEHVPADDPIGNGRRRLVAVARNADKPHDTRNAPRRRIPARNASHGTVAVVAVRSAAASHTRAEPSALVGIRCHRGIPARSIQRCAFAFAFACASVRCVVRGARVRVRVHLCVCASVRVCAWARVGKGLGLVCVLPACLRHKHGSFS